jgi:CRP-like cAMP-binding protein/Pyruvate/2-oxoacid:ferredoxin oxidoreductase delta subunit
LSLSGRPQKDAAAGSPASRPAPLTHIATGPGVEAVEADDLLQFPIFQSISRGLLEKNRGAIVRRRFHAGEIVCREGEFGSTAFYMLEGRARVSISTPMAHVKTRSGARKFYKRLTSSLATRSDHHRDDETTQHFIPIDASVDLAYDHPVAELGPGDLFGEMTCMSFYPRSATVQAQTDCVMFEMLRNILDILQKNKPFREQIDAVYRQRALENHIRNIPIFAELTSDFIDHLKETVELVRAGPGEVILRQGEPADGFYLIRIGFVKILQDFPGGELVSAYLSRGDCFGEIGLLGGVVRTATAAALDHVEMVRISTEDFRRMVEQFPGVRRGLERLAAERELQNRERLSMVRSVPLDHFLSQGLMEAQSLLILDLERCTRCDACVRACADAHDGFTRLIREGLRFDKYLVATSCRQCADPLCMIGCPVGAIRRRNSLEVIIEDWCIGCGLCARNCPYGNINLHPFEVSGESVEVSSSAASAAGSHAESREAGAHSAPKKAVVRQKATTCDLCTDQKEPACVYSCPHDAAHRVDPRQFFAGLLGQAGGK